MANCVKCGCKYKMNANRTPTCALCRRDARETEQFCKWEERFEASMGPKPDYVTFGQAIQDLGFNGAVKLLGAK
jgi:hypothetical protein